MAILIKGSITFEINDDFPFLCFECGDQFPSSHKLNIHISQAHTTLDGLYNIQKESHGYYKCPQCILVFGKVDDVEEHLHSRHNVDIFLQTTIHRTIENSLRASEPSSLLPVIPSSQIIIQKPSPIRVSVVQSLATSNETDFLDDNNKPKQLCNCGKCYTCHTLAKKSKPVQLPVIRGLSAANLQRIPANTKTVNVTKPAVLAVAPSTPKIPVNVLCFECGRGYDNASDLKNHSCSDGTVKKSMYSCCNCKKIFEKCEDLHAHENTHPKTIRPYKCGLCGMDFSTGHNLETHILWHSEHDEAEPSNAATKVQAMDISSPMPVQEKEVLIPVPEAPEPVPRHICPVCKKFFKSPQSLEHHMKAVGHSLPSPKNLKDPLDISSPSDSNTTSKAPISLNLYDDSEEDEALDPSFKCNKCSVLFGSKKFLDEHTCTEDSKVFKCLECNQDFDSKKILDMHIAYKHKKTLKCEKCNVTFDGKVFLDNHMKNVHDDDEEEEEEEEEEEHPIRSLRSKTNSFRCSVCQKILLSQTQLDYHVSTIHKICGICGTKFSDPKEQAAHIIQQHANTDFYGFCKLCNKFYKTPEKIDLHNEYYHSRSAERYCDLCDISFSVPDNKETHMKVFHGPKNPPAVSAFTGQCDVCGKICKGPQNLRHHYFSHQKNCPEISSDEEEPSLNTSPGKLNESNIKLEKKEKRKSNQSKDDEADDDALLDCGECGQKCRGGMAGLKKHLQTKHGKAESEVDDLLDCSKCGKKCKSMVALVNHMRTEHEKAKGNSGNPFQCGECGKVCKKNGIHNHMRKAHGIHDITAKIPDKIAADSQESVEEPTLKCAECGKVCKNNTGYRNHIRLSHGISDAQEESEEITSEVENDESLKCGECGKICKSQAGYHNHMRCHRRSESEPASSPKKGKFECTLCKQIFKSTDLLKSHQKVDHANDHYCFTCEIPFTFRGFLKRHFNLKHKNEKMHFESSSEEEEEESEEEQQEEEEVEEKNEDEAGEQECILCEKKFESFVELKSHRKFDHSLDIYCFNCNISFAFDSELRKHFKSKHKEEKVHYEYSSEEGESEKETVAENECSFCDEQEIRDFAKHLEINHGIVNPDIILKETQGEELPDNLQALSCPLCFKNYLMKYNLRKHLRDIHHMTKPKKIHSILKLWKVPMDCEFCSEPINEDFNTHLQTTHKIKSDKVLEKLLEHRPLKTYSDGRCAFCGNGPFYSGYGLADHIKKTHNIVNPEYRIMYGGKTRLVKIEPEPANELPSTKRKYESSKSKSEPSKSKPEPSKRKSKAKSVVSCKLCETKDIPEINHHLESYHKITEQESLNYIINDEKPTREPAQITCFLCGKKSFLTLVHMRRHLKDSHLVKIEAERKKFEAMWKEKESPSFECEVCKECFPTESTLKRHKGSHNIDNGFFCSKCEVEFDSIYDLLRHEKKHEKKMHAMYSCTMCDKKFTTAKDLNNHLKTHRSHLLTAKSTDDSFVSNQEDLPSVSQLINESDIHTEQNEPMDMDIELPFETSTPPIEARENSVPSDKLSDEDNSNDKASSLKSAEVTADESSKDEFSSDKMDEDVVMKENDKPVDTILKSDSASSSDKVLQPEKKSILSPPILEFKPLTSLLLEAIQTPKSPNQIEDHLPENHKCKDKTIKDETMQKKTISNGNDSKINLIPLEEAASLEDQLEKIFGESSPGKSVVLPPTVVNCSAKSVDELLEELSVNISYLAASTVTEEKSLKCSICERTFENQIRLNYHLQTHDESLPHKCLDCKIGFKDKHLLQLHEKYHNSKHLTCDFCKKVFQNEEVLKGHKKIHEQICWCPNCGKCYKNKVNLINHSRLECAGTSQSLLNCGYCGKTNIQSKNFGNHMYTHDFRKLCTCNRCGRVFKCAFNLKRHEMIHSDEKPFECKICSYKTVYGTDLKRHIMTHEGNKPFKCKLCPRRFVKAFDLNRHARTHSGEKPYKCEFCSKRFSRKELLTRHIEINHDFKN